MNGTTGDDEAQEEFNVQGDTLSQVAIPVAVAIVGLAVGVGLDVQDFARMRQQPLAAVLGVLCQLVVVPCVGWILTLAWNLREELAVGMILLTACPGGSSSNYVSVVAGGDGALSVSLTAVSSIVTTFTIPLFLELAIRRFMTDWQDQSADSVIDIQIGEIMLNIAMLTIFPLAFGVLIRQTRPKLAERIAVPLKVLAALLLTAMLLAAVVVFRAVIRKAFREVAGPTILTICCMFALSYASAWALRLRLAQSITICVEASIQYSGLAIAIGLSMLQTVRNQQGEIIFDRERVVMPAAVYTVFLYPVGVGVIAVCWWWRGDPLGLCHRKARSNTGDLNIEHSDQEQQGHDELAENGRQTEGLA